MAVVKSNAYGHGLVEVAKIVKGDADWFGVDNINEALALRKAGIKKPILVLGYTRQDRLKDAVKNNISVVAYNIETIKALKKCATAKYPARIHIKIETGLARQGVHLSELLMFVRWIKELRHVVVEGISTHYANIEDTTDHTFANQQLNHFHDAIALLKQEGLEPKWIHTACSAAALVVPETRFNLIRLGISLYGLWSSDQTREEAERRRLGIQLAPVLTWKTVIAQVKQVPKNAPVSYGLTERVRRDSLIAVLPIGYWDGFDRVGMSSKGEVLIRGKRCKIIGRVCMNMCMADVTDVPGVSLEDEVVLIGKQGKEIISAEQLADAAGTINYEIVTRINPMILRRIIS